MAHDNITSRGADV